MICRTCFRRASAIRPSASIIAPRFLSTSFAHQNAAAAAAAEAKPDATPAPTEAAAAARSVCVKGTTLVGLNYFKGKEDPVALADEDYPEWLWSCLDVQKKSAATDDADAGDEFSKSKKQRRLAAKKMRQREAQMLASGNLEALAPKIPLQKQSINLAEQGEGVEGAMFAAEKREELRRAMRKERKAKIKEDNYLKSM